MAILIAPIKILSRKINCFQLVINKIPGTFQLGGLTGKNTSKVPT